MADLDDIHAVDHDEDCDCDLVNTLDDVEETDVAVDDTLASKDVGSVMAFTAIKYAPVLPPVKGNINLYAVAMVWLNDPGASLGSVTGAANKTAQIYKELSNGLLKFKVIPKRIKVSYNKAPKNIHKAEQQAKAIIKAPRDEKNIYAMVNHRAKGYSNAGGDIAHLMGTLTRDFCHEIGHLRPFKLGHSGAYKDGKLKAYDDGTSFMGRFSSTRLTGAQLYLLGWLPENKVAQYDIGDNPTDFNVCSLFAGNGGDSVKVVLVPRGERRPLYLSMPQIQGKPTLCLHLSSGRGTQRVAVFGTQAQYEGVTFQKVAEGDGFVTVRVSTQAS